MEKSSKFQKALNLVAAGLMIFFSIPKLIGAAEPKAGFEQFKSVVPLDPDTFRIFAGSAELFIAIVLLIFTFTNKAILGKLGYSLLLATMISGLILEFFARPEPMMMLVVIAIVLSLISIVSLKGLLQK